MFHRPFAEGTHKAQQVRSLKAQRACVCCAGTGATDSLSVHERRSHQAFDPQYQQDESAWENVDVFPDTSQGVHQDRLVVVANRLPVTCSKDATGHWQLQVSWEHHAHSLGPMLGKPHASAPCMPTATHAGSEAVHSCILHDMLGMRTGQCASIQLVWHCMGPGGSLLSAWPLLLPPLHPTLIHANPSYTCITMSELPCGLLACMCTHGWVELCMRMHYENGSQNGISTSQSAS